MAVHPHHMSASYSPLEGDWISWFNWRRGCEACKDNPCLINSVIGSKMNPFILLNGAETQELESIFLTETWIYHYHVMTKVLMWKQNLIALNKIHRKKTTPNR